MLRDKSVLTSILVMWLLSVIAVWSGLVEVEQQRQAIERLVEGDRNDRHTVQAKQEDWGDAAYYSFHLTYDPPSDFAFAALGLRDETPWKHRIRMLALEGQIYERDVGNPLLALIGRFDFAFLAAFLLPLVLIVLLHDLRASERVAGRHDLLVSTAGHGAYLWGLRASLRAGVVLASLLIPVLFGGWMSGAAPATLLLATVFVLAYGVFWTLVCLWVTTWRQPAVVCLTGLVGLWVLLAVLVPSAARVMIDQAVPVPSGADIIMTQREAVNSAWDVPKQRTMAAFTQLRPEWAAYAEIERPFEWKWYYAFQKVGDETAAALSGAYREGRIERDRLAARLALLAPPALLERGLQRLARTDVQAALSYDRRVREFHSELEEFYYPKLFRDEPFDRAALALLPEYEPDRSRR